MIQETEDTIKFNNKDELNGYKQTKYGSFPSDWQVRKIRDILKRIRKPVVVQENEFYKQIGIRSHGKGIFYKEPVKGKELGNKAVFWVVPDCFIVNIVFAWEMAVAKTTNNELGFIASHRFPMYKPMEKKLDLDFITFLFRSPRGKYLLNLASPGGAGRNKTLGQKEFGDLEVVIPKSVLEQRKISNILSTWDRAIDLKDKLIEQKREQKKGLIQRLLYGHFRLSGFSKEWKRVKLKEILKVRKEKSVIREDLPLYSLTIDNGITEKTDRYNREFLVKSDDKKYKISKKEDIVYNPSNLRYGAIALNKINHPVLLSPIYEVLYVQDTNKWNAKFIAQILSSPRQISIFSTQAEGTLIERMAVKIDSFLNSEIMVPFDINEQEKIAEILECMDSEINLLLVELQKLKEQKNGLMQLLLTGKVRVQI